MNVLTLLHDHSDRRRATPLRPAAVSRAIARTRQALPLRTAAGTRRRANSRVNGASAGRRRGLDAALVIPHGSDRQRMQVAIRDHYWDAPVPPNATRRR